MDANVLRKDYVDQFSIYFLSQIEPSDSADHCMFEQCPQRLLLSSSRKSLGVVLLDHSLRINQLTINL